MRKSLTAILLSSALLTMPLLAQETPSTGQSTTPITLQGSESKNNYLVSLQAKLTPLYQKIIENTPEQHRTDTVQALHDIAKLQYDAFNLAQRSAVADVTRLKDEVIAGQAAQIESLKDDYAERSTGSIVGYIIGGLGILFGLSQVGS